MVKGLHFGLGMFSFVAILAIFFSENKDMALLVLLLINSFFMVLNFWIAFKDSDKLNFKDKELK